MQSDAKLHTWETINVAVIEIFSSPKAKNTQKGVKTIRDRSVMSQRTETLWQTSGSNRYVCFPNVKSITGEEERKRPLNTETKRSCHCWWRKHLNINDCATATAVTMATQTSGAHVCENDSTFDALSFFFIQTHTMCFHLHLEDLRECLTHAGFSVLEVN